MSVGGLAVRSGTTAGRTTRASPTSPSAAAPMAAYASTLRSTTLQTPVRSLSAILKTVPWLRVRAVGYDMSI